MFERNRWPEAAPARGVMTLALASLLLAGCRGLPTRDEKAARAHAQAVAQAYRPSGQRPSLSSLTADASLGDWLRFALLNQPEVEAAYFDWLASVERITQERSLPDPRLTFQTDIQDVLTSVMPGLMQELPGPGKLGARAAVATAESRAKYFAFEARVLQTAFALKKAYYQLHFLTEKIQVNERTLELLTDLENIARRQNDVGRATLQDVLRAQIEQDRMATELANLRDARGSLRAQFKAALGLAPGESDPPWPTRFESAELDVAPDRLLETALARNPRLQAMQAEVQRAQAAFVLAYKARIPDFSLGLEADAWMSPVLYRPQLGMTVPLWRDKLAAQLAEAQAAKSAAAARLSAEQIALAVEVAEKSFLYREASRNLTLVRDAILPKARQALEVARAGYLAGRTDFFNLMDSWRTLLAAELELVDLRTRRELALADLSVAVASRSPGAIPWLPPVSPAQSTPATPSSSHAQ